MTQFEQAIKAYLDERAERDPLFAAKYANEKKSIEECCKFIEAEACDRVANKTGMQSYGMTDDEVYGLAVHYYDEDNITIKPLKARTEVFQTNVTYTPSEEEKAAARETALKKLQEDAYRELQGKSNKPKPTATEKIANTVQTSLFD